MPLMPLGPLEALTEQTAHILFTDIVKYSEQPSGRQKSWYLMHRDAIQSTSVFQRSEESSQLIKRPTGDGIVLLFLDNDPAQPGRCALELATILQQGQAGFQLRMGIHTGPVALVTDVNGNLDVTGDGINLAQRVMDSGDAGHILLSQEAAGPLRARAEWTEFLHDLGEVKVKHGKKLHLFNLVKEGLGNPQLPSKLKSVWSVPISRNPFFTAREKILERVRHALREQGRALLTGLGGAGKTQAAAEYAHLFREDYKAVLWATADSRNSAFSDFIFLANLLDLPEATAKEQEHVVQAVRRWMEANGDWLLILDNLEDSSVAQELIPKAAKGHVLVTTQMQATGSLGEPIAMAEMEPAEGALLLLRRASRIAKDAPLIQTASEERASAEAISRELGGLPLALDQAGAYIEETRCPVSDYLALFKY